VKQRLLAGLGQNAVAEIDARIEAQRKAATSFLQAEDIDPSLRDRQRRVRAAALFIESYRELPLLAWPRVLLDVIVELEENIVMLRHAHARMVERVIGRRVGTGGSGGVEYLDQTGAYRVFSDLWTVRTVLLSRERCPALEMPDFYGFAAEP
jgi:tryptophan 2,3-dioxygenase